MVTQSFIEREGRLVLLLLETSILEEALLVRLHPVVSVENLPTVFKVSRLLHKLWREIGEW